MEEFWKDIKGYEGLYQASNLGRIRSYYKHNYRDKNGAVISQTTFKYIKPIQTSRTNQYYKVTLTKNKIQKQMRLHRVIATTFIPNPYNKKQVNHMDGNKQNNRVDNLEWCTCKENVNHAYDNNLRKHKIVKMINPKTGAIKIFYRRTQIEKYLKRKVCQDLITRCCNGIRKTAYKMNWEYI